MEILSLGEKIKLHRKRLNMTLKDLAGDRITAAQISHIERDKSYPSQDLLKYFAKRLDVTVDYLVETREAQLKRHCEAILLEAETLVYKENYEKAIAKISSMVELTEKYEVLAIDAKAKYLLGTIYLKSKENVKAARYLEESMRLYTRVGDYEGVILSYLQLGTAYYNKNYFHSALDKFNQAEVVIHKRKMVDKELEFKTYYHISLCYVNLGKGNEAIDYALKAKEIQKQIENSYEYGETLSLLASGHMENGDVEMAMKCLEKALEMYKQSNEKKELALIEDNLGHIYMKTEKYDQALAHLDKAYHLKKEIQDDSLADTILAYANYYIHKKDYDQAHLLISEALEIGEERDEERYKVNALKSKAKIYKEMAENHKAIEIIEEIIELLRKTEMPKELAKSYLELAELFALIGEDHKSVACYQKGVDILKKVFVISF
ncbi:tetratricopeptide (TPR) repeat protein [Anaerosolibacter carboniphilus]|uniref:Tetratricopeptide (TPR) repeat protein n=1 Tax=Anaerosolibacter carboniphilus TaxID=1417629 RepID=A0A841L730_9FIRM|nr:tetratricopeptide repeat protein [Anaerosolibacter carboniphilus]MBB6218075.1 tetratricopeptide (TPR) repeat protein [Anaerosolibacter carboniphilus]